MALISCPECTARVSNNADACPKCGHPFFRTEYRFIEVYLCEAASGGVAGQNALDTSLENGWQIVDTRDFVDDDGVEVTKYKLAMKVSTLSE